MQNVIQLPRPALAKLQCSSCGATADAACECGVAYVPERERATKAIEANPEKSDRAIAAEIGVGKDTVRRARNSTGADAPVDTRVGLDGRTRKLPTRSEEPQPVDAIIRDEDIEVDRFNHPRKPQGLPREARIRGFLYRANESLHGARADDLSGIKVTAEMLRAAEDAAEAWNVLVTKLSKRGR